MINLIPPEGHRTVKREYLLRVGAVFALLFASVFVLLAIALIPMYVLINAQISTLALEIGQGDTNGDVYKKADGDVQMTKSILKQLEESMPTVTASVAITEIQNLALKGISFKTFSVDESKGSDKQIQIQGIATTREVLAQFKQAIETSSMFAKAEVPISDLARENNLPFKISVTLTKEN